MKFFWKIQMIVVVLLVALTPITGSAKYLVYDSGGDQNVIQGAMTQLGFTYDVRNATTPVTAADLAGGYEALVIGWSLSGYNMNGPDSSVLTAGITGNKIITGHDADLHTYYGVTAAATFMQRAVLFAGAAEGTGILAFPVFAPNPFSYLPSAWGIDAFNSLSEETITEITAPGVASGLYSGLSLSSLSNWINSYHAGFSSWGSGFNSFEIGSYSGGTNVTIGTTVTPVGAVPLPPTVWLLGSGLIGLAGLGRKFKLFLNK